MDDMISRQAAIDEAKELYDMGDCYCDRASMIGMLNSLPSAQPEHKKSTDNGCTFLTCKHGGFGDDACSKCRWAYRDMYEANEEGAQE